MNARRVARLRGVRERALSRAEDKLRDAVRAALAAREEASRARALHQEATLSVAVRFASDLETHRAWTRTLAQRAEAAELRAIGAERDASLAREELCAAKAQVRQIELLEEAIVADGLRAEARSERAATDALAARRSREP